MEKKGSIYFRRSLIWGGIFIMFFSITSYWQPWNYALISAVYDTITLLILYRLIETYLFPKYYENQRKYFLISFTIIAVYSALYFYLDYNFIPRVDYEGHQRPPIFFHYFRLFMGCLFTFFIATSMSLMKRNSVLLENEKMLTEEKLQTELKLLKAQINPHFIFNALNNIYALTYMKSENAPDSVLKLSDMLRYVFYDCNKDRVPVASEITYIENFIAFQQMKSEFSQNIAFESQLDNGNNKVAPMLFVPLIENAFKYSRIEEDENAFVKISIKVEEEQLYFEIENSVPELNKPLSGSGTGIKNVEHRLNILYPNKHQFDITDQNGIFKIDLKVTL